MNKAIGWCAVGISLLISNSCWAQATLHVVGGNPDAAPPYADWGTAAATIRDAIDAAVDGDIVIVADGTYALTQTIWVAKGIVLRSQNGPAQAVISGQGQVRCLYVAHAQAVIDGFTIANGYVYDNAAGQSRIGEGRGAGLYVSNALAIRRCVIRDCEAKGRGADGWYNDFGGTWGHADVQPGWKGFGRGGGIYLAGGAILENCLVWNNRAHGEGGNSQSGFYDYSSTANGDGSGYGGGIFAESNVTFEVRNCTVVGNQAEGTAGSTIGYYYVAPGVGRGYGGGISAGSGAAVSGSIVWSNASTTASPNWQGGSFLSSCAAPLPDGADNLADDPAFVDAAGGDFQLAADSPCVNAGLDQPWMADALDLAGNARIAGGTVDMGAYEWTSGASPADGFAAWAAGIANGLTNYQDSAAGDGYPNLLKYATGGSATESNHIARLETSGTDGLPRLRFRRNTNATDVVLTVEGADEIGPSASWRGIATNLGGIWSPPIVVEEGGGNPVDCTLVDPVPLATQRILRLKVSIP